MKQKTRNSLIVALVFLLAALGVLVWAGLSSATDPYPRTPEAWNAWLDERLAEQGRVRGENWDVWLDVSARLQRVVDTTVMTESGSLAINPDDTSEIASALDRLSRADGFLYDFPLFGSQNQTAVMLDHLGSMRRYSRLVDGRLALAVEAGRFGDAAAWVDRNEALRRPIEDSGALVGNLVGVAVAQQACGTIRRSIGGAHFENLEGSEELQAAVARIEAIDIGWAMRCELFVSLPEIAQASRTGWPVQSLDQIEEYEALMADIVSARSDPAAAERVGELVDRLGSDGVYAARRRFLATTADTLIMIEDTLSGLEVERGATLLMIAIARHRFDHGLYPDSLDALVPVYLDDLPRDVLAPDGLFRYRVVDKHAERVSDGVLLYSVGPDGVDDGGVPLRASGDWPGTPAGDRVFSRVEETD